MTHLHSDVLPASNFEQPKLSLLRGHQIVRRPVKALLGIVLIGSAMGIGGLIAGRSAAPGIDQSTQVSPAALQSSSVAAGMYQSGALAGHAPVEEWRAAEAGAYGSYAPDAFAGQAGPAVWAQFERGEYIIPPNASTLYRESEFIPEAPEYLPAGAPSAGVLPVTRSAEDSGLSYYADQDGAGLGYTGDGLGHHANGFLNRNGEPYGWVP